LYQKYVFSSFTESATSLYTGCTRKRVEEYVMSVLRNARDREGGRDDRRQKKRRNFIPSDSE